MEITEMRDRVIYLAGQLEEAKRMLQAAAKEIENANKKPSNGTSETSTTDTGTTVFHGE